MERVSKASRVEQTNERVVQVNEQMDEQVAHYLRLDSWLFWTIVWSEFEPEKLEARYLSEIEAGNKQ